MGVIEETREILAYGTICNHCLGRFFGKRSFGLANEERGRALRTALALEDNYPYTEETTPCWICGNMFDETDAWAERIEESVQGIEFKTLLVGCRVPPIMAESEEMVWSDIGLTSPETLKAQFNREVGKAFSARSGSEVDFKRPDLVAVCNPADNTVEIEINPIYIYGRYRKYERGIPQTRWHCRECHGEGCERCNFTGKMYPDSVEELIGRPVTECCSAEDVILHGAGREDIDARMIGTGRPFIMEIVHPNMRSIPLSVLEERINSTAEGRVTVMLDHISDRREVETIKSGKAHKKYSILVEVDGDFSDDDVRLSLSALKGASISQRTPQRVAHRRADKERKRDVIDIYLRGVEDGQYRIEVLGDAGLYIKELISGDEGRTIPSLTECIGAPAKVTALDVIMVEGVVPEKENKFQED
ncbi:tRNA pseudouridine(54/55) synthase Pus10 [Methanogenium cariaci]